MPMKSFVALQEENGDKARDSDSGDDAFKVSFLLFELI